MIDIDLPARALDILVAGCGTGVQSIETAARHPDARILAIDISLASLAYARRKTREAGIANIEYAQADITMLGALDRRFDVIECVGVLHHLADPLAGWRTLLSLLRPGGLMRVGLYSERARRFVVEGRDLAAARGYEPTPEDIRAFRQELISRGEAPDTLDFYSLSGVRDLFFHAMEHRFTVPQIAAFLRENGLRFLGFDVSRDVIERFRTAFPASDTERDPDAWEAFEAHNPRTFIAMYQFWVEKPD